MKIIVVGGGTAGLLSALILKHRIDCNIRVIKSDTIGIIGVGEGTTEHWSDFIKFCGIDVDELIKETDATFKIGVKFEGWGTQDYLHSINSAYELVHAQYQAYYAYKIQKEINSLDLHNPNLLNGYVSEGFRPFQFHFNTFKLNEYLIKQCHKRNIDIIEDTINKVVLNEKGIQEIKGEKNSYLPDFYIDATGFRRVLLSKLDPKWISFNLPMNEAITFQTKDTENYNCYTLAKCMNAGWAWSIPTFGRGGNGYVFNNNYINKDKAKEEMETRVGHSIEIAKNIKFESGYIKEPWIKNCCAIGLSASFIEPLEASSIGSAINQIFLLGNYISNYSHKDIEDYNKNCEKIFLNIKDFVSAHYLVGKNTSFWNDLKIDLDINHWKNRLPIKQDFQGYYLLFTEINYILLLHGINFFDVKEIKKEYNKLAGYVKYAVEKKSKDLQNMNYLTIPHKQALERIRNT